MSVVKDASAMNLCWGTAQLGLDYGITNARGRLSDEDAAAVYRALDASLFTYIDTASSYGDAEERLAGLVAEFGSARKIISKVPSLRGSGLPVKDVFSQTCAWVRRSLSRLGVGTIQGMLLHDVRDMETPAWDALREMREQGLVEQIGVSVYTPEECRAALKKTGLSMVQIPFNILDQRWCEGDVGAALRADAGCDVFARSIYLQGVLLAPPAQWPVPLDVAEVWSAKLDALAAEFGLSSRVELCNVYARSFPWIEALVLGFAHVGEVEEAKAAAALEPLTEDQLRWVGE